MSGDPFLVTDAPAMARMINATQQANAPHVPIFQAAMSGAIALVMVSDRKVPLPLKRMERERRPVLVLIGDDDYASTGPAGWHCARKAAAWTRAALIHGAAGHPDHYQAAVANTLMHGRFLMVETAAAHLHAWAALLATKPALVITPTGGQHPLPPPREALQ